MKRNRRLTNFGNFATIFCLNVLGDKVNVHSETTTKSAKILYIALA